ncbi:MAG TPA: hypothetical protein VMO26_16150 [Vicinamibacterales bacterium]|nr:hypothetical protein [Vicinamibacterales bacterium]
MKVTRFAKPFGFSSLTVLVVIGLLSSLVRAQGDQTPRNSGHHAQASDDGLVSVVREATRRFHDVSVAEAEGYHLMFGCVSGPDWGAMGLHYVNLERVTDGELDPAKPEIVIYEPTRNGRPRLVGADYLVFAADWDKKGVGTPQLMGQLLHLFESPNRFGLPAFYTLHVWAWKENPTGMFVNWHSKISCEEFSGPNP